MKTSFVFTILLWQIVNISSLTEIQGVSISQEKCEFYQNMFQPPAYADSPFLVRIYSGYYLNANLVNYNNAGFLNGILISEDFVLSVANNRTETLLFVEVLDIQLEVIQKVVNEQQSIMLLKLSKSIDLGDQIRPVCLPQTQPNILSQIICWVDSSWLNRIKLKLPSRGSCKKNSDDYIKRLRIQGVNNGTNFCTNVVEGDRDRCNMPGSVLLNDQQEVVGVATGSVSETRQMFVQLSEHVIWIENIVWPSSIVSSTTISTEETSVSPFEYGSNISETNVFDSTTTTTPRSTVTKAASQIDAELHDIHIFLNVNLILIVVILFIVLCLSTILWSDGLCIREALPNQFLTSTDV
ncbi:uncharacterized protein LOC119074161 [Bradysia coprophila]|uniref:uncharacterized protein LOC119074161 n=1 Tax=Bradysia coprophila TaxID=38358 RepID=UPI00187D6EEC|nr:uncharacterized protein LOC119074161 [Bradysia coprophila]